MADKWIGTYKTFLWDTPDGNLGEGNYGLGDLDKIGMGLKGASLLGKTFDAFQSTEQEQLQLNPERQKVKDLMAGRNIDFTQMLNEINLQKNAALNSAQNSRSVNTQRALNNQIFSNTANSVADAKLKERSANNQYRGEEANTRNILGAQESAERVRQQNVQSQNDAAGRMFKRDLLSDVSKIGTEFNKAQYDKDMIKNKKEIASATKDQYLMLTNALSDYFDVAYDETTKKVTITPKGK
jgi:hypothetical protein